MVKHPDLESTKKLAGDTPEPGADLMFRLAENMGQYSRMFKYFAAEERLLQAEDGSYPATPDEQDRVAIRIVRALNKVMGAMEQMKVNYETPEDICDALIAADKALNKARSTDHGIQ